MLQSAPDTAVPRVSITPVLRSDSLKAFNRSTAPTLLDGGNVLLTTSGRAALAIALRNLGIGPRDEVLIPAYHCLALSSPIAASQANPPNGSAV